MDKVAIHLTGQKQMQWKLILNDIYLDSAIISYKKPWMWSKWDFSVWIGKNRSHQTQIKAWHVTPWKNKPPKKVNPEKLVYRSGKLRFLIRLCNVNRTVADYDWLSGSNTFPGYSGPLPWQWLHALCWRTRMSFTRLRSKTRILFEWEFEASLSTKCDRVNGGRLHPRPPVSQRNCVWPPVGYMILE